MNIILISLFTSLILHGHVNIGFRWRLLVAKVTKKPMEELLLKPYKIFDCFPCLSFWIACIVAVSPWWLYPPSEVFCNLDWQQIILTFFIATLYSKIP